MKTWISALATVCFSSAALAQSFTVSGTTLPAGTTFTGSGTGSVTLSNVQSGTSAAGVTGLGTATVNAAGSGFNRYNVALSSSWTPTGAALTEITLGGAGSLLHAMTNAGTRSDVLGVQSGAAFSLSNKVISRFGTGNSSANLAVAQAPVVTSSSLTGSVPVNVTADVDALANSWTFNFPGGPTGNAVIDLGSVASTFARNLSLGFASQHRDNVQIRVSVFLNGTQVGSTVSTAFNTALGVNVGSAPQSISSTALGNFNIPVASIYESPKVLTVTTELWGRAFSGNATTLGDYLIGGSSSAPITVNAVPEPASMAALAVGLVTLARRRRNK